MNWWVLRRRPHVSWLIAITSVSIIVGVILAQYTPVSLFSSALWCAVGGLLILTGLIHRYLYLIPWIIIGGIVFGLWRGSLQTAELADFQALHGQDVSLVGSVSQDVGTDATSTQVIRLSSIENEGQPLAGNVWVTSREGQDIKRGDRVTITGKVAKGFGSFAATIYDATVLAVQRPEPGDVARQVRDWFADGVRQAIAEPEASLGIGFLVGQKSALPVDLAESLKIVGLTHIVVASGYNLTILVRLARRVFEKISKYMAALASAVMILAFIAVTGMSPSMSRAGLVAGLSLAAWYYGRRFHPLVLLSFAAAVTVVINPSYAWGDLGWQLSFAAFGGVMIVAPLLQRYFFGDKKINFMGRILFETFSALIATAPILIGAFGQFSNVALFANMLVLPLVPLAMLLTFIAGVGVLATPVLSNIIGLPASWLLQYMTAVSRYLSELPWAVSTVSFSGIGVGVSYAIIIAICIYLQRTTRYNLRDTNLIA